MAARRTTSTPARTAASTGAAAPARAAATAAAGAGSAAPAAPGALGAHRRVDVVLGGVSGLCIGAGKAVRRTQALALAEALGRQQHVPRRSGTS